MKTEAEITRVRSRKIWIALTVMAIIALVAAFFLDQATAHWINAHPSPELKRVMQIVSRVGDWPEHIIAGTIGIAIAFAVRSKVWVRIFIAMVVALFALGVGALVEVVSGDLLHPAENSTAQTIDFSRTRACIAQA